jgi:hypothetical protein
VILFPHLPLENGSVICSANWLLTASGNWHTATNLFELLSAQERQAYFRYQLVGLPLSVICRGCPIELNKQHILALAAETGFLLFKEQVPLKLKKEISAIQYERKIF